MRDVSPSMNNAKDNFFFANIVLALFFTFGLIDRELESKHCCLGNTSKKKKVNLGVKVFSASPLNSSLAQCISVLQQHLKALDIDSFHAFPLHILLVSRQYPARWKKPSDEDQGYLSHSEYNSSESISKLLLLYSLIDYIMQLWCIPCFNSRNC